MPKYLRYSLNYESRLCHFSLLDISLLISSIKLTMEQSSFLCEISDGQSAVLFSRTRFSKLYNSLMKDLIKKNMKKISFFVNLLPNF